MTNGLFMNILRINRPNGVNRMAALRRAPRATEPLTGPDAAERLPLFAIIKFAPYQDGLHTGESRRIALLHSAHVFRRGCVSPVPNTLLPVTSSVQPSAKR